MYNEIQKIVNEMTIHINENGDFTDSQVDYLNSCLFQIEKWNRIEIEKRHIMEIGLSSIIKDQLDSQPGIQFKSLRQNEMEK